MWKTIKGIRDARIKDGLPRIVTEQDWVPPLSEAIGKVQEKILDFTDASQVYTAIDMAPEKVLDALAVNWKIDWYDDSYDIVKKRQIVKVAIKVRKKMGTVAAVRDMLESIFENAKIIEWFETGEQPGTFDVEISSAFSESDYENFMRLIDTTKRLSAHLNRITSTSTIKNTVHTAGIIEQGLQQQIDNDMHREAETHWIQNILVVCTGEMSEAHSKHLVCQTEGTLPVKAAGAGTRIESMLCSLIQEGGEREGEICSVTVSTGLIIENAAEIELEV